MKIWSLNLVHNYIRGCQSTLLLSFAYISIAFVCILYVYQNTLIVLLISSLFALTRALYVTMRRHNRTTTPIFFFSFIQLDTFCKTKRNLSGIVPPHTKFHLRNKQLAICLSQHKRNIKRNITPTSLDNLIFKMSLSCFCDASERKLKIIWSKIFLSKFYVSIENCRFCQLCIRIQNMLIYNNYVFQVYVRICPATYVPQNVWYMFLNGYTIYMYTIHINTVYIHTVLRNYIFS